MILLMGFKGNPLHASRDNSSRTQPAALLSLPFQHHRTPDPSITLAPPKISIEKGPLVVEKGNDRKLLRTLLYYKEYYNTLQNSCFRCQDLI